MRGRAQLRRQLDGYLSRVAAEVARAMEREAAAIVAQMRQVVPVESGALRDSIGWTWDTPPKGALTIGTFRGRKGSGMRITLYAGTRDKTLGAGDAFYAAWQEFGTATAAAQPYFWPVWRANRSRIRAAIARAIRTATRAEAAKYAGRR